MIYNMDKLFESVREKGHVCIGLDTAVEYIPPKESSFFASDAEAVLAYNITLIDATFDIAACYKLQIAYYEEMGIDGLKVYKSTLEYIREKNVPVIADIKRSDIADTAKRYANAHFSGDFEADFVTLNPYLGMDSIEPWFDWAVKKGKGAFVLMRTSNKGRKDFEELIINENEQNKVYDTVGNKLLELAKNLSGEKGYGVFGAVIGADPKTQEEKNEAKAIRKKYSNLFFLIPGYGAQGGAAEDAALLLHEGNGGVVNASRSILKAWIKDAQSSDTGINFVNNSFAAEAARKAAIEMRDAIRTAAKNA